MPDSRPNQRKAASAVGAEIQAIAKNFNSGTNGKAAHLVNLSLATLKYLLLNAESDDIRYQAATALLGLAPIQQKLDYMRGAVNKPERRSAPDRPAVAAQRLRAIMTQSPEVAQRVLQALAEAEKEAQAAPDPQQKAA